MNASQIIFRTLFSLSLFSSMSFAAGLESTTGVSSNSGALLDSGTAAGAVKDTRPADGAITTPPTGSTTGMTDTMQPTGITKKTSRARAKQVCAANDTHCQQDPAKPKTEPK